MNNDNRIPVTIITGYLGAGKTSFINWFIQVSKNKNLAVIENEFGEISIDCDLIRGVAQKNIYNITNGCICCSAKTEFADLLDNYLNTFRKLDHLLIESTGIADPVSLVLPFYNNYGLQLNFKIQNVICIIDAFYINETDANFSLLQNQIALADTIILNKTDLIQAVDLQQLEQIMQNINALAHIHKAIQGNPDTFIDFTESQKTSDYTINNVKITQSTTGYVDQLISVSLEFDKLFDPQKLTLGFTELINDNYQNIVRAKGVFFLREKPYKTEIQSVRNLIVAKPVNQKHKEVKTSKIVLIGKNLDKVYLHKAFQQLLDKT
jgi:G3E family GTPase